MTTTVLEIRGLSKSFTMHLQGGLLLPVVNGVGFKVKAGQCVVLGGPSGAGKSSVLKMIFGNYRSDAGEILLRRAGQRIDIASARPREIIALRGDTIGYVSQFLRAIPRVPTIEIVAEQLLLAGLSRDDALKRAANMLRRLNISERLWDLPPATFSGGEQQRVNIARGFLPDLPLLLLDEPTASLDADNRAVVVGLIAEKKKRGTAIVAIAHDDEIREAIADEVVDIRKFAAAA